MQQGEGKKKELVGNHADNLLALMPLNSQKRGQRGPVPKHVIDKS